MKAHSSKGSFSPAVESNNPIRAEIGCSAAMAGNGTIWRLVWLMPASSDQSANVWFAFSMLNCLLKAKNKSQDGIYISIDVMWRIRWSTYHLNVLIWTQTHRRKWVFFIVPQQKEPFLQFYILAEMHTPPAPEKNINKLKKNKTSQTRLVNWSTVLGYSCSQWTLCPPFGCHGADTSVLPGSS